MSGGDEVAASRAYGVPGKRTLTEGLMPRAPIALAPTAAEAEADAAAHRIVLGEPATVVQRMPATIARMPDEELAQDPLVASTAMPDDGYHPDHWDRRYQVRDAAVDRLDHAMYATGRNAVARGAAHDRGGTRIDLEGMPLTAEEIVTIAQAPGLDDKTLAALHANAGAIAAAVNTSFRIMGLDTIEACATYLAHASVEGAAMTDYSANADPPSVGEFKGRGALQVTFRENYLRALGALDARADQLAQQLEAEPDPARRAKLESDRFTLVTTSQKIKADPAAAESDPQTAFLFSAGHMYGSGGVDAVPALEGQRDPQYMGDGANDRWEAGTGNFATSPRLTAAQSTMYTDAGKLKQQAHARAYDILLPRVVKPTEAEAAEPAS